MAEVTTYKIVLLGAGAVGKSAITVRMVSDEFRIEYDPTIEDSYSTQIAVDKEDALLDILDTAGQDQFAALQDHWIRESQAFILVYSIENLRTFNYVEELNTKIHRNKEGEKGAILLVLAGNKCDLPESDRQVTFDNGKDLADRWNCPFLEVSAKTGENVAQVFMEIVRLMRKEALQHKDDNNNTKGPKKTCCLIL